MCAIDAKYDGFYNAYIIMFHYHTRDDGTPPWAVAVTKGHKNM